MSDKIIQGSPEWFAQRLGKVTASRIADVMAKTKSGYGASRATYMTQLLLERLTGTVAESYQNDAMKWGTETEPLARAAYEAHTGEIVEEVPMIQHPKIEAAGASPDGLVGDSGLLEIKCPTSATHVQTLLSGKPDNKYVLQMQWQMACTGRAWCDFVSFDPRFPDRLRLFAARVKRDDALIGEIEKEVRHFLTELRDMQERLQQINEPRSLPMAA